MGKLNKPDNVPVVKKKKYCGKPLLKTKTKTETEDSNNTKEIQRIAPLTHFRGKDGRAFHDPGDQLLAKVVIIRVFNIELLIQASCSLHSGIKVFHDLNIKSLSIKA